MTERNNTQKAICDAFMREWATTDYNRITIRQLCKKTPVARTTFYSYYRNLDEVKQQIEDEILNGLNFEIAKISPQNKSLRFKAAMHFLQKHKTHVRAFLIEQPNNSFREKWKNCIKLNFLNHYVKTSDGINVEMLANSLTCAIMGAYEFWLDHADELTEENLSKFIEDLTSSISFA